MSAWACVLLLAGVFGSAHSQLGEGDGRGGAGRSLEEPPVTKPPDDYNYYDDVVYDEREVWREANQKPADSPRGVFSSSSSSSSMRPVESTYQGCLAEEHILNGTFRYVNFTQAPDKVEACFTICLLEDPFSFFISLNKGLDGNNDKCGCHSEDEMELGYMEYDDSFCDSDDNFAKIYCGPENVGCLNGAVAFIVGRAPSSLVLFAVAYFIASFSVSR